MSDKGRTTILADMSHSYDSGDLFNLVARRLSQPSSGTPPRLPGQEHPVAAVTAISDGPAWPVPAEGTATS